MSQTVFLSPPNNSMELNTGDAAERGVTPKALVDGINSMFAELYIQANQKPIGSTAILSDSRGAQIFTSQTISAGSLVPTSLSGYNHFNWGNARSGHRLKLVYNGGVSGDRADQMIARLPNVVNSGAGHMWLKVGVNDVSQAGAGYTTVITPNWPSSYPALPNQGVAVSTANVASVCFSFIQYAVQQFFARGGKIVTLELERGGEGFSTAQIAANHDLNALARELAETVPNVNLYDDWKNTHDPAASTTTTIRFKAGYMQEAGGSGVHEGNLGGYMDGIPFETYLRATFPDVPYLPADVNEIPTISTRNLLLNPLFVTATGGTANAGASGTVPGSWIATRSGGSGTQSVVVSTGTPADGSPGLETIMACTFSAAGDLLRLQQDATIGNVNIGDYVEAMAAVKVDAASALAGAYLEAQYFDGTSTSIMRDLFPLNNVAIGVDGFTASFRTPAYLVTAKAGGAFLTMRLYAQGSAAGTGTVRFRTAQIRKRNTP
jgi:lysophospholipase L1-like esterase